MKLYQEIVANEIISMAYTKFNKHAKFNQIRYQIGTFQLKQQKSTYRQNN